MNYKIKIALASAAACAGLALAATQAYAALTLGSTSVASDGNLTVTAGTATFSSQIAVTATSTFNGPLVVASTTASGINFKGGAAYLPLQMGTFSSTVPGRGVIISAANPRAIDVYVDDNNAAIAQGTLLSAARFRMIKYASSITEDYAVHGLAKFTGAEKGGWGAGVMGAVETAGTVALAGQSRNIISGVLGRFGTAATLNTNTANDRVAAVTGFNNNSVALTGSGKSVGVLVTEALSGAINLDYGLEIGADVAGIGVKIGNATTAIEATADAGPISSESHGIDLTYTGQLASNKGMVGINSAVTTGGANGAWASGMYAKVVQGTTKNVDGYLSGAEFEVVNTNTNPSDWFPLVLNANSTNNGSHSSYIALRDYNKPIGSFVWFGDDSIGGNSATSVLSTYTTDTAVTHSIRIIIGGTPYWIMLTNTAPH